MKKLKHKGLKIILLIALFLIIILVSVLIIVNNNLNSILTAKVKDNFNKTEYSDYYTLSFKNLHINIITGIVKLSEVEFMPKQNVDTMYFYNKGKYKIKIKDYVLKGANIYKYIETDTLNVSFIKIIEPEIELIKYTKRTIEEIKKEFFLSPKVKVQKFIVEGASFSNIDYYSSSENKVQNINLTINNLNYKSDKTYWNINFSDANINADDIKIIKKSSNSIDIKHIETNINKLSFTDKIDTINYSFDGFTIHLSNIETAIKNNDYKIHLSEMSADIVKNNIEIHGFKLKPRLTKEKFAQKYKFQKDRFDVDIKAIKIIDFNIDSLLYNNSILVENINIEDAAIEVYKDKTKAQDLKKLPLLPCQAIKNIPLRLDVKTITSKNINFIIKQKTFDNKIGFVDLSVDIDIKNITNIHKDKALLSTLTGNIHKSVPFTINIKSDYIKETFSYTGKIKSFDLVKINDVLNSFYPVIIKKGNVKSIQFNGTANKDISKGSMVFIYSKLKLKVLTDEYESNLKYYKNDIITLTANTMIYSNNPSSKTSPVREVNFIFERDKNKGFPSYFWKSVFTGISETLLPSKENRKNYSKRRKAQRIIKKYDQ